MHSCPRPISHWRVQHVLIEWLRTAIKGTISIVRLSQEWAQLQRHWRDTPRQRPRRTLDDITALRTAAQGLS